MRAVECRSHAKRPRLRGRPDTGRLGLFDRRGARRVEGWTCHGSRGASAGRAAGSGARLAEGLDTRQALSTSAEAPTRSFTAIAALSMRFVCPCSSLSCDVLCSRRVSLPIPARAMARATIIRPMSLAPVAPHRSPISAREETIQEGLNAGRLLVARGGRSQPLGATSRDSVTWRGSFRDILTPNHDHAYRSHLHCDIKRDNRWFLTD